MAHTASIFRDKILINCNLNNFDLSINSSLLFKDDFSSFTIKNINKYYIEKNFKRSEQSDKIYIFKNCEDLAENDYIDLTYKEMEFINYTEILDKQGEIYVFQEFFPEKGKCEESEKTILKIKNINEKQEIEFDIIQKGKYTLPPEEDVYFISKNGAKIKINHLYDETGEKKVQSNMIKKIFYYKDYAIIELFYNLQNSIQEGVLFAQKILVDTFENLKDCNKRPTPFILLKNYLPNLDLHYEAIDDPFWGVILQKILLKMDKKIGELEEKIKKISN